MLPKYNHLDIYSFELYEDARPKATTFIKGQVTDAITGKSVKAAITILDLKTKKVVFKIQTDENGEFISGITVGKNYVCIAENKLYTYHAENFDLTDVKVFSKPYNLDIKLQPIPKKETIEPTAPIILQNIFFNTGSADLLPESSQEIALISNMMSENKNISIQIIGHTDDVGHDADNQLLSEQRAKAVATAIIAKGISPDRIQSIGKGETQPIAENTSDEGRRKNRRTEMLVKIQ
jgi:outer membrane protein OmpA-like peptidoglycan-associated protein